MLININKFLSQLHLRERMVNEKRMAHTPYVF